MRSIAGGVLACEACASTSGRCRLVCLIHPRRGRLSRVIGKRCRTCQTCSLPPSPPFTTSHRQNIITIHSKAERGSLVQDYPLTAHVLERACASTTWASPDASMSLSPCPVPFPFPPSSAFTISSLPIIFPRYPYISVVHVRRVLTRGPARHSVYRDSSTM
jgi:hypothetical protein